MTIVLEKALSYRSELSKNYIINGAMQVSQELGTASTNTDQRWPVDMFQFRNSTSAGNLSAAQATGLTAGGWFNRLRMTVNTADTSITAGEFAAFYHNIEGTRCYDLKAGTGAAKTVTLQFGVKAPAGTYCVAIRNGAVDRSYVAEYVISAGEANTDVIKRITFQLDQAGTWLYDTGCGIRISWTLAVGSTFQTTAGAWVAGNFLGTANQFNFAGSTSNVFELYDVSLTEGSLPPPFKVPDFVIEKYLCQRYWEKSYDYATAPGAVASISAEGFVLQMSAATIVLSGGIVRFKVPKRVAPTIVNYSPNTGASGKLRDNANGVDVTPSATDYLGENGYRTYGSITANVVTAMTWHWTADARLT